jgi:photosystem II stability/assembly factor-like uncharacterized protein
MILKKILKFVVLFMVCMSILSINSIVQAKEWTLLFSIPQGMPTGWINQLIIHPTNPNTLYGASEGAGFIVSTDGGKSWVQKNQGFTVAEEGTVSGVQIRCMAMDSSKPETIYAGLAAFGVFKSTDGGNTWKDISSTLDDTFTKAMVMHPKDPKTVYLGTDGGGIYKYDVANDEWQESIEGLKNTFIKSLVMDPNDPKTIYVTTDGGIAKTTDGAKKWTIINNGITSRSVFCIDIDPKNPKVLYAGTETGGLFKTTDGGANWASVGGEIWMSKPSTEIFAAPTDDIPSTLMVTNVAVNPSNTSIVYASNTNGVYRSADAGETWTPINDGLTNKVIKSLTVSKTDPVKVYVSTIDGKFFVYVED